MIKTLYLILWLATPDIPVPDPQITEVKSIEECIVRGTQVLKGVEEAGKNEQYKVTFSCQIFQREAPPTI